MFKRLQYFVVILRDSLPILYCLTIIYPNFFLDIKIFWFEKQLTQSKRIWLNIAKLCLGKHFIQEKVIFRLWWNESDLRNRSPPIHRGLTTVCLTFPLFVQSPSSISYCIISFPFNFFSIKNKKLRLLWTFPHKYPWFSVAFM